jgi:hypothetical protein
MRLCNACLDSVFATYGGNWARADVEDDVADPSVCASCEKTVENQAPHAFFLTAYVRGQERQDWFGVYCRGCADALVAALSLEP